MIVFRGATDLEYSNSAGTVFRGNFRLYSLKNVLEKKFGNKKKFGNRNNSLEIEKNSLEIEITVWIWKKQF